MEMICRALLVYCVKHYKGDDKIKSFIWDLITPIKDGGSNQALQNHSGTFDLPFSLQICTLCAFLTENIGIEANWLKI